MRTTRNSKTVNGTLAKEDNSPKMYYREEEQKLNLYSM